MQEYDINENIFSQLKKLIENGKKTTGTISVFYSLTP